MAVKFEITAKCGEYEDRDGTKKARYTRCGVVFEGRDGKLSAKLDALPVAFDGWLNFWEPKEKDNTSPMRNALTAGRRPVDDIDSDVPF